MRTRSRNWLYLRVCVAALLAGLVVGFVAESPATATPPPTTSVLVPANGATLSGTAAAVDATASNATSVEFWLLGGSYGFTGHLIGTATSTLYGWVYSWNTTTVPNGSYALLSEAIGAGGSGFSAAVSITITNDAVQNCDDWGPYADLQGCDLSDAELSDVNLTDVNLTDANLTDANLSGANLSGAFLDGVTSGGITGTPSALPNSDWMLILGYLIGPYV